NTYVSLGEDAFARETLAQAQAFNRRARRPSLAIEASTTGRLAYYAYQDGQVGQALAELDTLAARLQAADTDADEIVAQLAKTLEYKGSIQYSIGDKEASRMTGDAALAAW